MSEPKLIKKLSRGAVPMFVIYDHPNDAPDGFVVRIWTVVDTMVMPGKLIAINLLDLAAARAYVPHGFVSIGRMPDDDPKIVEVWI